MFVKFGHKGWQVGLQNLGSNSNLTLTWLAPAIDFKLIIGLMHTILVILSSIVDQIIAKFIIF